MNSLPRAFARDMNLVGRASRLALIAALGAALGACATAQPTGDASAGDARVASAAAPVAATAGLPAENFDYMGWDAYLGGGESSQYSALDQITKENVGHLEVAWEYPTGEGQPPRFNPVIGGGRMYVVNGGGQLVALDPASGAEIWVSNLEGRIGSRGVNYWESEDGSEGRLMVLNSGILRAIDAATGQVIQGFGGDGGVDLRDALPPDVVMPGNPLMTDNPGRIYRNTIVMSLPAGAYDYASAPANIHAYDVLTGELKWTFNTVPREGEFGHDTWPDTEEFNQFGGVHNWSESTVDTELGIVYIPTGTPRYDFYGGNREGDNLFGNSIIALDAETGERIWHFQTVHHDLWDFDLPAAPKLMTITKGGPGGNGERIPIVIQPTKHGYLFAFDRRTGEPVWPIEERPVPASDVPGEHASPTQPVPTWPEPYMRMSFTPEDINPYLPEEDKQKLRELFATSRWGEGPFIPPSVQGTIAFPGHNGGTNWGNVAADPERGRLYVVSRELPLLLKINPDNREEAKEAMPNADEEDIPYRWPVNFMLQSNGMGAIKPPFSNLTAYDMNTGEKLWSIPNGEILTLEQQGITGLGAQTPRGGPVATASGLLFVGTATDRAFRARDADTGEVLWEHRFDAATEGVPAVYQVNGRQYITVPVGGVGHFAGGLGLPEPGPSKYVTFALPQGAAGDSR